MEDGSRPVLRRPRNRRQLILDAAGEVFTERGYHGAGMDQIARRVDITATALYRHFGNKYALFSECTRLMIDGLLDAVDELPPEADLRQVLTTVAEVTVEHRTSGGLYRWEARFLEPEDRQVLRQKFARLTARVADLLAPQPDAELRAVAALGCIGSITMHRTPIGRARAVDLLVHTAIRVASPPASTGSSRPAPPPRPSVTSSDDPVPSRRRDQILEAAIRLFAEHGYHDVPTSQIAAQAGLTTSGIYRHFATKADILAAGCLQAAAHLDLAVATAVEQQDPAHQVLGLAEAYVAHSFENTALNRVAEGEIVGLPEALRAPVVAAQRQHVALWERALRALDEGLDARRARTLVHAGFGVVVEAGRHLRWEDSREHRSLVTDLLLGALLPAADVRADSCPES